MTEDQEELLLKAEQSLAAAQLLLANTFNGSFLNVLGSFTPC
jgi:hypothetical protein